MLMVKSIVTLQLWGFQIKLTPTSVDSPASGCATGFPPDSAGGSPSNGQKELLAGSSSVDGQRPKYDTDPMGLGCYWVDGWVAIYAGIDQRKIVGRNLPDGNLFVLQEKVAKDCGKFRLS